MPHPDNAAVAGQTDDFPSSGADFGADGVQKETGPNTQKLRGPHASRFSVLDSITESGKDRFWERVEPARGTACRKWTGGLKSTGYGIVRIGMRLWAAHRVAYELTNGRVPPGKLVRHACDNPPCCNPDHLIVGTQQDNVADRERRRLASHDEVGLIPIEEAALSLRMDPKRLRGYIWRNRIGDPIGDATMVYDWSLAHLRERTADTSSAVQGAE